jgi:hypothetical protein
LREASRDPESNLSEFFAIATDGSESTPVSDWHGGLDEHAKLIGSVFCFFSGPVCVYGSKGGQTC